jgi:murein DD-endopeptidase MepM/ murein hydrolase activator NlpD
MSGEPAAPAAAFFWLACGFAVLSALPLIYDHQKSFYLASELFYACPVTMTEPGVAFIRYDAVGKGYFGASRSNNRTHKGIDLYSPLGQPVFASKSGRVAFAGIDKGYGNYVELSHPDGLLTRYAHLATMTTQTGDWLSKGQILGTIGKTGNADDPKVIPHLHFEIRYKNHALDPSDTLLDPTVIFKKYT